MFLNLLNLIFESSLSVKNEQASHPGSASTVASFPKKEITCQRKKEGERFSTPFDEQFEPFDEQCLQPRLQGQWR